MPALSEVAENAAQLKKRIADEAGIKTNYVNDTNLVEAQKILAGAGKVQAQGADPRQVDPGQLKQVADAPVGRAPADAAAAPPAAGGSKVENSDDLSKQQKIAMAIVSIAPTLLGYTFGGKEGGAIGAQQSTGALQTMGKQAESDRLAARELSGKKELQAAQLQEKREQGEKDRENRKEIAGQHNETLTAIKQMGQDGKGPRLSKGEEAVDKGFAKEYNDYVVGGGYANSQKSIKELDDVIDQLGKTNTASGPMIGSIPLGVRERMLPGSAIIQQQVENVVQRSLREVLGAQFTQKEGEQLLSRAYNPKMSESENAARVGRLRDAIKQAADSKMAAADYYEQNGTLKGYKGTARISAETIADAAGLNDDKNKKQGGGGAGGAPNIPGANAGTPKPDFDNMDTKALKKYLGH